MGFRKRVEKIQTGQVPLGIPIQKIRIINVGTSTYAVSRGESGALFTTRGSTSSGCTFTLPPLEGGLFFYFFNGVNFNLTVQGENDNELLAFNDLDADNVRYVTANERVGGGFLLVCDGTLWHAFAMIYGQGLTAQTILVKT